MILQAIMDSKYKFIDVFATFPGSVSNSHIFFRSNYQLLVTNDEILNRATIDIQGVNVYEFIIGDAVYMVNKNMLAPRLRQRLLLTFLSYNLKHSSTRMCVERAFDFLKKI